MANLNKVILIGRIVADPDPSKDIITFQSGGKVTKLRFVVNNRKFDQQKQDWVDDPVWLDLKFFNRGENGKLADRAAALRKPQQICLEGHLVMEEWDDKQSGQKRQKILVYVDSFQLLDRREDGGGNSGGDEASTGGGRPQRNNSRTPAATGAGGRNGGSYGGGNDSGSFEAGSGGGEADDIPF